jgi:hypothetical protein
MTSVQLKCGHPNRPPKLATAELQGSASVLRNLGGDFCLRRWADPKVHLLQAAGSL